MASRTKQIRDFDSLYELLDYFDSEEKCTDYLALLRWNGKPECPYCANPKAYELKVKGRDKRWKCSKCRKQFSVRVGTIFEESKLPLRKWFVAIYLICAHKKGISSHQLAKDIKITQKSAWFVLQRVRETFRPDEFKFEGNEIEVDDSYFGGSEKNKHKSKRTEGAKGRSTKTKTPVLGIMERKGKVYALPVQSAGSKTVLPILKSKVNEGAKVYTDEFGGYRQFGIDYDHQVVNHKANEYVRGEVHTNNIEGFWAIVKRGIYGVYHHASPTHLFRYINEFTFRFNNRNLTDGSKFDVAIANTKGRLDYKSLTRKTEQK